MCVFLFVKYIGDCVHGLLVFSEECLCVFRAKILISNLRKTTKTSGGRGESRPHKKGHDDDGDSHIKWAPI